MASVSRPHESASPARLTTARAPKSVGGEDEEAAGRSGRVIFFPAELPEEAAVRRTPVCLVYQESSSLSSLSFCLYLSFFLSSLFNDLDLSLSLRFSSAETSLSIGHTGITRVYASQ